MTSSVSRNDHGFVTLACDRSELGTLSAIVRHCSSASVSVRLRCHSVGHASVGGSAIRLLRPPEDVSPVPPRGLHVALELLYIAASEVEQRMEYSFVELIMTRIHGKRVRRRQQVPSGFRVLRRQARETLLD